MGKFTEWTFLAGDRPVWRGVYTNKQGQSREFVMKAEWVSRSIVPSKKDREKIDDTKIRYYRKRVRRSSQIVSELHAHVARSLLRSALADYPLWTPMKEQLGESSTLPLV